MNYRDRYVTVELEDDEFTRIKDVIGTPEYEETEIDGVRTSKAVSYTHLTLPTSAIV